MRKICTILVLVSVFGACGKEPVVDNAASPEVSNGILCVSSGVEQTKTYVEGSGNNYITKWSAGDKISMVEIADGIAGSEMLSSEAVLTDSGRRASFNVVLPPNKEHKSYQYAAIYKTEGALVDGSNFVVDMPATQHYGLSFDKNADLLTASVDCGDSQPAKITMNFKRLCATVKMTVKGLADEEKITKITITGKDVALAGKCTVDMAAMSKFSISETSSSLTLIPESSADNVVWFRCLPGKLSQFEVKVETTGNTYLKTVTKGISLPDEKLTIFNLNVAGFVEGEVTSIYMIGNSFTMDAAWLLPNVVYGSGINNVELVDCYEGGWTVSQYVDNWATKSNYTQYYMNVGDSSIRTKYNGNLKEVAESRDWDIVCIQEHTGRDVAWIWNETEMSKIRELMDLVAATQTVRPKFYYLMSQVYYDQNRISEECRSYITWTDQAGMYDVITAFARKVMENLPFDGIIATGTMLQNLRQTPMANSMCLTRDGYHLDYGLSRYGAACTVFESALNPIYKVNLWKNSYRNSTSNTSSGSYTTPITDYTALFAIQAALDAVSNPFELTFHSNYGASGHPGPEMSDSGVVEL